ncbi:MAG: ABC transporter ATP-binding protein [Peptostreptococcaceae bacterium]|nr:ABC transporter ATP-binding protein [Peptostreptococcaceae bacterium]
MIEFKNVSKSYNNRAIIENLNLVVDCGSFLTIIGTSGSGKTTIMKMINGLVKADEGEILINGKNIENEDLIELRRNTGYAIQGNILFPHLTVYENIGYVLNLMKKDKAQIRQIVEDKLKMLDLPLEIMERYPHELSGGQQQRVGIARALSATPDILLMDEPFGAVDAITRNQLQNELKELHRKTGITIVFITHDIVEALKLGTEVLVIDEGVIQQHATPDVIKNQPANAFVKKLIELAMV